MQTLFSFSGRALFNALLATLILFSVSTQLNARPGMANTGSITGTIYDHEDGQPVPFANVALFDSTGTRLLGGCAGNQEGFFSLAHHETGSLRLRISAIGYDPQEIKVEISGDIPMELGSIGLRAASLMIGDIQVSAERIKASTSADKTTFMVNARMKEVTSSGMDILRLIPGVQADLFQNISLNGSGDVLILVNGRERDRAFLNQIPAWRIDKIEISANPPAQYEGKASGVINVILTRNTEKGVEGQAYAEIPPSGDQVFVFPAASLGFNAGKFSTFLSWNGEMRYFDITDTHQRMIKAADLPHREIVSVQNISQKNWQHRFNYGTDFIPDQRNQLSFYGYYSVWSQEHDGTSETFTDGISFQGKPVIKEDDDINRSLFSSVYYRHFFNKETGHEVSADVSHLRFTAGNSVSYLGNGAPVINRQKPEQNSLGIRLDHNLPLSGRLALSQGYQLKSNHMADREPGGFSYRDQVHALYAAGSFSPEKTEIRFGMRFELAQSGTDGSDSRRFTAWLPEMAVQYRISSGVSVKADLRQGIQYPGLYQLNPAVTKDDPFSSVSGNDGLQPEERTTIGLEFSFRPGNQYLSARIFHRSIQDAIHRFTTLTPVGMFDTRYENAGNIRQTGIQLKGALNLGRHAGINHSVGLTGVQTQTHAHLAGNNPDSRNGIVFDCGISAFVRLRHQITAAGTFQYTSPMSQVQADYYSGALYFLSLEKSFGESWKAGITGAMPFAGSVIYRGYEIADSRFDSRSEGVIHLSELPLILKLTYRFRSGREKTAVNRPGELMEVNNRKGF
ncbi:MAG: TonB-dependent receptor [Bacteroidota bacterium]